MHSHMDYDTSSASDSSDYNLDYSDATPPDSPIRGNPKAPQSQSFDPFSDCSRALLVQDTESTDPVFLSLVFRQFGFTKITMVGQYPLHCVVEYAGVQSAITAVAVLSRSEYKSRFRIQFVQPLTSPQAIQTTRKRSKGRKKKKACHVEVITCDVPDQSRSVTPVHFPQALGEFENIAISAGFREAEMYESSRPQSRFHFARQSLTH